MPARHRAHSRVNEVCTKRRASDRLAGELCARYEVGQALRWTRAKTLNDNGNGKGVLVEERIERYVFASVRRSHYIEGEVTVML